MSATKRAFVGNVTFTFTKGRKSVTFTMQMRMEIERQTTGTEREPLETWLMTASRKIIGTSGFDTKHFDESPVTVPCQMDMRADAQDWCAALKKTFLSPEHLEDIRRVQMRKLKAQKGSYKRGEIWEEQV